MVGKLYNMESIFKTTSFVEKQFICALTVSKMKSWLKSVDCCSVKGIKKKIQVCSVNGIKRFKYFDWIAKWIQKVNN